MNWELDLIHPLESGTGGSSRPIVTLADAQRLIDHDLPPDRLRRPHWRDVQMKIRRAAQTETNLDRIVAGLALEEALWHESRFG